jgi:hypothetical protein
MRNATLVSSTTAAGGGGGGDGGGFGGGDPEKKEKKEKKVWVQEGLEPPPAASALAAAAEGCGSGESGAGGDWSGRPVVEYPLSVCAPALLPFAARWVRQEKHYTNAA